MAKCLGRLESVANFTEFVKAFSVFGAEMVELAHVTGKQSLITIYLLMKVKFSCSSFDDMLNLLDIQCQ